MSSNTKSSTSDAIPEILLEGLALDVSILDALLKRHRCSHGRTIYFRRMSMTLNRLLRGEIDSGGTMRKKMVATDMVYRLNNLQKNIFAYNQEQKPKSTSRKRRHNEGEEKWDLQSLHKTAASATSSAPKKVIVQDLKTLINFWTSNIPEILSRIQHASKSLFIEVSRGFFLPFCTVALSALARIRSLLMGIGVRGLTSIRALSDEALQVIPKSDECSLRAILIDTDYEHYTNLFLEDDDDESDQKKKILVHNSSLTENLMFDRKAILRSLGLTKSTKRRSKAGRTRKHNDSDIPTNGNEMDDKQSYSSLEIESQSVDGCYALSSSTSLGLSEANDAGNYAEMDDGANKNASKPLKVRDSLDRNMELVNRFQKQKTTEKKSKKKDEKSKKIKHDSKLEAKPEESERKSKKRKPKKKESNMNKKKKKGKNDFFDQLFD